MAYIWDIAKVDWVVDWVGDWVVDWVDVFPLYIYPEW